MHAQEISQENKALFQSNFLNKMYTLKKKVPGIKNDKAEC